MGIGYSGIGVDASGKVQVLAPCCGSSLIVQATNNVQVAVDAQPCPDEVLKSMAGGEADSQGSKEMYNESSCVYWGVGRMLSCTWCAHVYCLRLAR